MKVFIGLVKRELWEHPALFVGPLGANLFVAISMLIGIARGIGSEQALRNIASGLDVAGETALEVGRNVLFASPIALVLIVTVCVGYFYFIDCLYAERRERSILFFKSLPVTDTQTVLSKLFAGVIMLPLLSLAAFILTQLFVLLVATAALTAVGGRAGALWSVGGLLSNWGFALYSLLSMTLWFAPFIAFLVLVSAWARRAVFLWSLAPLFLIQAEYLLPGRDFLGPLVFGHVGSYFAAAMRAGDVRVLANGGEALSQRLGEGPLRPLDFADPVGFLSEPALWVSLLVAAAFVAGAIALRRYRDDS